MANTTTWNTPATTTKTCAITLMPGTYSYARQSVAKARAGLFRNTASAMSAPKYRVIRGRMYAELVDEQIEYGVRGGTELVMNGDRRVGRVMGLGRCAHHELGMDVEDVEPAGHLDQPGADRGVADPGRQLADEDLGQVVL